MRYEKQFAEMLGSRMAYVDVGSGDPIVFLHGNPTSSYLWRNVIPHLVPHGRCIAPDLIGMGDSAKLADSGPGSYRFVEHRRYLDALLEQLGVHERVTLVVHDWGSGLGFDWANRHRDAVSGIAYMEAVVKPVSWDDWPESARGIFQAFRSEAGESIILERNMFVEKVLPASILRTLSDEEMDAYRAPFREPGEGRRPTLTWPREIPVDGESVGGQQLVWRPFSLLQQNRGGDGGPVFDRAEYADNVSLVALAVHVAPLADGGDLNGDRRRMFTAWHEEPGRLSPADIVGFGRAHGLGDVDRPAALAVLAAGHAHASELGAFGTPTLVFGAGQAAFVQLDAVPAADRGRPLLERVRQVTVTQPALREWQRVTPAECS